MASAKDGFPHIVRLFAHELATLDPRRSRRARCGVGAAVRAARRRSSTRRRRRCRPADADHRGSHRQGAGGRAAFPSGTVLPAAELRVGARARGQRAQRPAADGRHRAHRRVGRQGARAAVADRARARRVQPAVRVSAEGRTGRGDGTDRHADRNPRTAGTCCCSAAASATPCCSRSRRRCASTATASSTSPATRRARTSSSARRSRRRPIRSSGAPTPASTIAPGRPQDRALPRQHRAGDARVPERRAGRAARPARHRSTASSRSARTA